MPSPLLHTAAGIGLCLLDRRALAANRWRMGALVAAASILPDFDVLPGLVLGDPNRFHGDWSHSVFVAACAGLAGALLARTYRLRVGFWVFAAWTLHGMLDAFAVDGRPPYGVPLFWPVSTEAVQVYPLFPPIRHGLSGASTAEFFSELFSLANLKAGLVETVISTVLLLGCWKLGTLKGPVGPFNELRSIRTSGQDTPDDNRRSTLNEQERKTF